MYCDTYAVSPWLIPTVISGLIYRAMGEIIWFSRGISTNVPSHRLPYGLLPGSLRRAASGWLARSLATGASRTREVILKKSISLPHPQMMLQEGGVKIWRPRQVCVLLSLHHRPPYDDHRSMSALVNVTTSPWRNVCRLKATGRPHLRSCTRGEMFTSCVAWIVTLTTDLFYFSITKRSMLADFKGKARL